MRNNRTFFESIAERDIEEKQVREERDHLVEGEMHSLLTKYIERTYLFFFTYSVNFRKLKQHM